MLMIDRWFGWWGNLLFGCPTGHFLLDKPNRKCFALFVPKDWTPFGNSLKEMQLPKGSRRIYKFSFSKSV
jgi:hypothetical protein